MDTVFIVKDPIAGLLGNWSADLTVASLLLRILLSLILPRGFWWFALGAALIAFGIWANNRCC